MKLKRFLLPIILIFSLILSIPVSASAAGESEIIRDLIIYYSHHQEAAETDILRLLNELREVDPEAADNWQLVLEGWHQFSTRLEVTPGVLPDGLPEDNSLCIVVMGYALTYDGYMKDELLGRLQVVLDSAAKYPNAYILCTGGGTAPGNYFATEAGRMASWLEKQGIDPERIIVENRSYSTEQNALYSLEILRESYPQVSSLALVSSDYHLRQCHVLFQTVMALHDLDEQYAIVGNAGFEAGYVGDVGYFVEAESIGLLLDMHYLNKTAKPALSQLAQISVAGSTEYMVGDELALTVTAGYDTGFTRDVTADAVISGYDPTTDGTQEVTVTYTENGITLSETLQVGLTAPPVETTVPPTTAAPTIPTVTETIPETKPIELPEPAKEINWIPVFAGLLGCIVFLSILLLRRKRRTRGKYLKRGK